MKLAIYSALLTIVTILRITILIEHCMLVITDIEANMEHIREYDPASEHNYWDPAKEYYSLDHTPTGRYEDYDQFGEGDYDEGEYVKVAYGDDETRNRLFSELVILSYGTSNGYCTGECTRCCAFDGCGRTIVEGDPYICTCDVCTPTPAPAPVVTPNENSLSSDDLDYLESLPFDILLLTPVVTPEILLLPQYCESSWYKIEDRFFCPDYSDVELNLLATHGCIVEVKDQPWNGNEIISYVTLPTDYTPGELRDSNSGYWTRIVHLQSGLDIRVDNYGDENPIRIENINDFISYVPVKFENDAIAQYDKYLDNLDNDDNCLGCSECNSSF